MEDTNLTAMRGIRKSITTLKKKTTSALASDGQDKIENTSRETVAQSTASATTSAKTTEDVVLEVAKNDRDAVYETKEIVASKTEPEIKVLRRKRQSSASQPASSASSGSLTLDIKFQFNSQELTQTGINALDILGSALVGLQRSKELPKILLEGHTDDTGDGAYNLVLSQNRANSARDYLLTRFGLPEDFISAQGYGESEPKVPNVDSTSREANRRVELRVVN